MRAVLIAAIILVLLAIGGYLTVFRDHDRTSINFETQKLEQDTKHIISHGNSVGIGRVNHLNSAAPAGGDVNSFKTNTGAGSSPPGSGWVIARPTTVPSTTN